MCVLHSLFLWFDDVVVVVVFIAVGVAAAAATHFIMSLFRSRCSSCNYYPVPLSLFSFFAAPYVLYALTLCVLGITTLYSF